MANLLESIGKLLDRAFEDNARNAARRHGRRSTLAKLGGFMAGAFSMSALPFDRAWAAEPASDATGSDDQSCDYWRYCALDGFLCTTAGGSVSSCPVGSEASLVSWVGTCHNPGDGRDYLISYYDCCGKIPFTGAQFCLRNEGERPGYSMGLHNDIDWCMANSGQGYHCTVALVIGTAE